MKKRIFALLIALMMVFALPMAALADDGDGEKPPLPTEEKESNIQRVEISMTTATVRVNQKRTLSAEAIPFNSRDSKKSDKIITYYWNEEIYWSSSNPEIATVNGDGIVTGISPGTAVITATAAQNGKSATCVVTVPGTVVQGLQQETTANREVGSTSGEVLTAAALRAEVETAVQKAAAGATTVVTFEDKTTVSTTALRGAAYIAELNGGETRIRLATTQPDSGKNDEVTFYSGDKPPAGYQGYLQINPALAGDEDIDLSVAVYTSEDKVGQAAGKAKSTFGSNAAVVQLAQKGTFGFSVTVGAKVDVSGFDTQNLKVYSFDEDTGAYSSVNTTCTVNTGGYAVFAVKQGGTFVITDRVL